MALERIQKGNGRAGAVFRRSRPSDYWEGRVKVNGHPVKLGDKMDVGRDTLMVDGERVRLGEKQEHHYLALYKPRGYVTTTSDERGRKTVMDLLAGLPAPRCSRWAAWTRTARAFYCWTNDGILQI